MTAVAGARGVKELFAGLGEYGRRWELRGAFRREQRAKYTFTEVELRANLIAAFILEACCAIVIHQFTSLLSSCDLVSKHSFAVTYLLP